MEDSDWRSTRNLYETLIEINENLNFTIWQLEEMSIADSMMMLMEMRQNDTEISGSHLWTGSYLLAKYLVANWKIVEKVSILELGAGTGLVSMVADRLGAKSVLATDGDMETVELLKKNVVENSSAVEVDQLYWGVPSKYKGFQVLLAGDVLYKIEIIQPFLKTVRECLRGQLILCHIPRAKVTHAVVEQHLREFGFTFEMGEKPEACGSVPEECPKDEFEAARIYIITC